MQNSIILKEGKLPGKTTAIFAGVHGNELNCVRALDYLINNVNVSSGKVYFVYANPTAIKNKVRQVSKNLNRCFKPNNSGKSYEDERARELMKLLDDCDALLDLHEYNEKSGRPFAIAESIAIGTAACLGVEIISTGWTKAEPGGTDDYMLYQNKPGVCLECGPCGQPEQVYNMAIKSACQFLDFYGNINDSRYPCSGNDQKLIKVDYVVYKKNDNFRFLKEYKTFDKLEPRQIFAEDGDERYLAKENQYIIFPRQKAVIGEEVFIIGNLLK